MYIWGPFRWRHMHAKLSHLSNESGFIIMHACIRSYMHTYMLTYEHMYSHTRRVVIPGECTWLDSRNLCSKEPSITRVSPRRVYVRVPACCSHLIAVLITQQAFCY